MPKRAAKILDGAHKDEVRSQLRAFYDKGSLSLREMALILHSNPQFARISASTILKWFKEPTEATEKAIVILKEAGGKLKHPIVSRPPLEELECIHEELGVLRRRLMKAIQDQRQIFQNFKNKL